MRCSGHAPAWGRCCSWCCVIQPWLIGEALCVVGGAEQARWIGAGQQQGSVAATQLKCSDAWAAASGGGCARPGSVTCTTLCTTFQQHTPHDAVVLPQVTSLVLSTVHSRGVCTCRELFRKGLLSDAMMAVRRGYTKQGGRTATPCMMYGTVSHTCLLLTACLRVCQGPDGRVYTAQLCTTTFPTADA